jgi:hypothetical protein
MPSPATTEAARQEGLAQARTALSNMAALSPTTAQMIDAQGRVVEGYDLLTVLTALVGDLAAELDTVS